MNLANTLQRIALADPERPAVFFGEQLLHDYGQLARRAAGLAAALRGTGLVPGDRIALCLHNHPAYLELLYGAWWAGLAVVPVNAKLHAREAEWIIGHAGAKWTFATEDIAASLQLAVPCIDVNSKLYQELTASTPLDTITPREPQDLAWLFYTSGTTGRPKGVMLTHRNLLTMALGYFVDVDAIGPNDAILYGAPMSHGAGIYALPHVLAGARHIIPASGAFDAAEVFGLARSVGPVSMFCAPTMVNRLVRHARENGLNGDGFKTIVYGGAPMYAADIRSALDVLGPRFVQIYGQGESPMAITALSKAHLQDSDHPAHSQRVASVGIAQSAVTVRIADATGHPLPINTVGEVQVRGDTVMAGYWQDERATRAAIQDGWLFTGDMGEIDAHGFLTLKDRSKDMVISGGSNIYPREVEEVLLLAPGVAEVSVIGVPDAEWGEVVVAFVVAQPGHVPDAAALDATCLAHIARFKRPKHYRFVTALPKNNYGKILKTTLRNDWKDIA